MMRKIFIFFLAISLLFLFSQKAFSQKDHFCALYFTFIGCPNCAVTDPIVLEEWTSKYPNLVIIEYGWKAGDWDHPNSQFFGKYAKAYQTPAAVPQLVFDKSNIKLGRIEVPKGEEVIKTQTSNPCPLIEKSISFENLDLNQLPAFPKIWANQRVLIKLNENEWLFEWNGEDPPKTIGKEKLTSEDLKELLFTQNLFQKLENKIFEIVPPQKVEFSGSAFPEGSGFVPYAQFEHAIKIKVSQAPPPVQEKEKPKPEEKPQKPEKETITLPLIGKINPQNFSLPFLTFLLALADGFNPCAFFVLTFLLSSLIGLAGARKKILLVGGIFIFFSALFYFLFMAVLFNVFQLGKKITFLTLFAGLVAILAGLINIKDYFYFQKGISLTLPKSQKEKFFEKVKKLSLSESTWALILSTSVIASTVNLYELLCTFGFPMIYTRILSLKNLSPLTYYLYLIFYNLIYVLPLVFIVLIFALTLGRKTFSQIWVRRFKLASGLMILFLGLTLIFKPALLENALTAFSLLFLAFIFSLIIILFHSFLKKSSQS